MYRCTGTPTGLGSHPTTAQNSRDPSPENEISSCNSHRAHGRSRVTLAQSVSHTRHGVQRSVRRETIVVSSALASRRVSVSALAIRIMSINRYHPCYKTRDRISPGEQARGQTVPLEYQNCLQMPLRLSCSCGALDAMRPTLRRGRSESLDSESLVTMTCSTIE